MKKNTQTFFEGKLSFRIFATAAASAIFTRAIAESKKNFESAQESGSMAFAKSIACKNDGGKKREMFVKLFFKTRLMDSSEPRN